MTRRELEIAGAMLYVCEGTKLRRDTRSKNTYLYAIELTNSNPRIIALFAWFLKKIIHVEKSRLRGQLFIYPELDKKKLIRYWSNISSIPVKQFQKTIVLKQKTSRYKPNPLGTFKIRYSSKKDFLKLQKIIDKAWRDTQVA